MSNFVSYDKSNKTYYDGLRFITGYKPDANFCISDYGKINILSLLDFLDIDPNSYFRYGSGIFSDCEKLYILASRFKDNIKGVRPVTPTFLPDSPRAIAKPIISDLNPNSPPYVPGNTMKSLEIKNLLIHYHNSGILSGSNLRTIILRISNDLNMDINLVTELIKEHIFLFDLNFS